MYIIIFLGGVHGVGKTYFCNLIKEHLDIEAYSASTLIADKKKQPFAADKLISDIDVNQQYLLDAIDELKESRHDFILDGHFCLLNADGVVTKIELDTFTTLRPDAIILLTEEPEVIAERRKSRDNLQYTIESIRHFQVEELCYAKEVSNLLSVDLLVTKGSQDVSSAIEFIKNH